MKCKYLFRRYFCIYGEFSSFLLAKVLVDYMCIGIELSGSDSGLTCMILRRSNISTSPIKLIEQGCFLLPVLYACNSAIFFDAPHKNICSSES